MPETAGPGGALVLQILHVRRTAPCSQADLAPGHLAEAGPGMCPGGLAGHTLLIPCQPHRPRPALHTA